MAREFRSFRVDAIVLKHAEWGEADRAVTIFSRQRGKLRTIAKGVRKIRSRRAGHLEPFTRVTLQLASSKSMPIVTQAETQDAHIPLRDDLQRIGQASYVVELLDRFTYEEGENIPLFNLLADTLERLEDPELDVQVVMRYYEMRLLDYVGFRPELFACVICGEEIKPEAQFFTAEKGGVVCPSCSLDQGHLRPVSMDALRFLRHMQRSSFGRALKANPGAEIHREMEDLMQFYLTYVLERGLNTPRFMRKIK
jgi:DNA repair protein RecO (recombination protein O)